MKSARWLTWEFKRSQWIPYLVLVGSLSLTALATFYAASLIQAKDLLRFQSTIERTVESIETRLENYIEMLTVGSGLYAASRSVSAAEFRAYVHRVGLPTRYPEIQGVAFCAVRRADQPLLPEVPRAAPQSPFTADLSPPPSDAIASCRIVYFEPEPPPNSGLFSIDIAADPAHRSAMQRACDTGTAVASNRLIGAEPPTASEPAGITLYVPVYRGGAIPHSLASRRAELIGFICSPIRTSDFIHNAMSKRSKPAVELAGFALAHEANPRQSGQAARGNPFHESRLIDLAGCLWRVHFRPGTYFDETSGRAVLPLIILGGLSISGVLFSITLSQTRAHIALEQSALEKARLYAAAQSELAERKRAEEALRQSEERFRLFVERAQDYAIFMMDPGGHISSWNPGAERIFGYSESEIVGQHGSVLFTSEDQHEGIVEKERQLALTSGQAVDERWHVRKNGSRFWSSGFLIALRDSNSNLVGFARILRDITQRKQSEESVRLLNQELEMRVERRTAALRETNEQLEAFTYTVAHDLRAPLRAMQGFSEALLEDYSHALDVQGCNYLQRVIRSAQRMDALIQDLLEYSRLSRSALTVQTVNLDLVLDKLLPQFEPDLAAKGGSIDVQRPLPKIRGHAGTIECILANLISNGIKFVAPDTKPMLRIWTDPQPSSIRLWVSDNGIGIAPQHRERIFGVFERLHGADLYPGTGIGLAIVRKAVERMNGTLGLESEPGHGSRFWIELPL